MGRNVKTQSTDTLFTSAGRALTTTGGVGGTGTYYVPLKLADAITSGYQVLGDGTIVCTVDYEFTYFEVDPTVAGATGVWKTDTTNVPQISVAASAGSGGIVTGIGNNGYCRERLKIVVTTNGTLKLGAAGKS